MLSTTYKKCLEEKWIVWYACHHLILKVTLNLEKSLNCKISKYNNNTFEHDEAEKACILGYWRMPKINSTVDWFAIANISALSMLEVLKKVVKV